MPVNLVVRARFTMLVLCSAVLVACSGNDDSAKKDAAVFAGIMADMDSARLELAAKHEFDVQGAPPAGWLEVSYLTGASSRPDMGRYFKSYVAYANEYAARIDGMADSIVDRRFRMAGYKPGTEAEIKAAFKRGYDRTKAGQREMIAAMLDYAQACLELHEFLVGVDAKVSTNQKNEPEFDAAEDATKYNALVDRVESRGNHLAGLQERAQASLDAQRKGAR